jgi:hypothetical protein
MRFASRHPRRDVRSLGIYLGDSQNAGVGGQVGGMLSSLTGIPGLGQIGSLIGGLLGPSAHYTPSGMLYDTAAETLKSQAQELQDLMNEILQREGRPPLPVLNWTMTSADDPQTGPYLASLLNNPAYASATSPTPLEALQASGVYDAAIKTQAAAISAIENELNAPTPPASYAQVQGGTAPAPVPGSYNDVTSQVGTQPQTTLPNAGTVQAGFAGWIEANPTLAMAGGALLLVVLLKK